jgi:hypothetical protein
MNEILKIFQLIIPPSQLIRIEEKGQPASEQKKGQRVSTLPLCIAKCNFSMMKLQMPPAIQLITLVIIAKTKWAFFAVRNHLNLVSLHA